MIKAFIESAKSLIGKPYLLVPTIMLAIATLVIQFFAIEPLFNFVEQVFFAGNVPEGSLIQMPYFLFSMYPIELTVMAMVVFFAILLQAWLIFVYGRFVRDGDNANFVTAISSGFANIPNALIIAVFFMLITFMYGVGTFILALALLAFNAPAIIGLGLMAIWLLFGAYMFIKLYFLPIAMAIEGKRLKQALGLVWNWSQKKIIAVIAIILAITIITNLVTAIGDSVSGMLPEGFLATLLYYAFLLAALSYGNLVVVNYYNLNRQTTQGK